MEDIKKSLDGARKLQEEMSKFTHEAINGKFVIPFGLKSKRLCNVYYLAKLAQLEKRIDNLCNRIDDLCKAVYK